MRSRGVRRPSVCRSVRPSIVCLSVCLSVCKHFAQIASYARQISGSRPKLHTMVPRRAYIQDLLKVKVEVKGHVTTWFGISQNSFLLTGKWLHPDQTQSFSNLPFPLSVRFSDFFHIPIPKWLWFRAISSAIAHMVKQFVRLFVIQYGMTFCIFALTLRSKITLYFQTKCQSVRFNVWMLEWATPTSTV